MAEHVRHHHVSHQSADDQYLVTPPGAGYEHTDADVGVMVKFAFWLAVSAILVHVGLGGMYALMVKQASEAPESRPYPIAVDLAPRLPAAPQLQAMPENEMYEFRLKENADLHSYGWVDKDAGIVHIPIEDGMRLMLERGLPTRDSATAPQAGGQAGMMPSDASSGRVLERRRQ